MEFPELNRRIIDLVDNFTDARLSALTLLSKSEEECFKLRNSVEKGIQTGKPLYGCGHCGQPVKVSAPKLTKDRHSFYFKHLHKSGDCPVKTDSTYTREEVQRMKYNGAKESAEHMDLKYYIASHLRNDERFTDVLTEKVVKGSGWSRKWKKPDISAKFNGKPVVFEIQLSTTFLDVIVSREAFYQGEGISIFWVFSKLNPESARATEKDVFFNNNANALSIDEASKERSKKTGNLVFSGHYKNRYFDESTHSIKECWDVKPIGFNDLKFDLVTHKPFFMSFDDQCHKAIEAQRAYKIKIPVERFEALALQHDPAMNERRECAALLKNVGLYAGDDFDWSFLKLVKALLSVPDGAIHFPNQDGKWAWLVNYVWEHHKEHWVVLLYVVNVYERTDLVFSPSNAKLQSKRKAFKDGFQHDAQYDQNTTYYPLLIALFPELTSRLHA